ncbi:hypothetical protein EHF_0086 [Ehrlichia japonica]|uniref:Uncharacterized protein n=1 Tax=Ehrlichia japonica TaxID=391036 RepID=X5H042_9RICK|nr:hypothetical protein EHF_0086 [Ehrlichia japonica]
MGNQDINILLNIPRNVSSGKKVKVTCLLCNVFIKLSYTTPVVWNLELSLNFPVILCSLILMLSTSLLSILFKNSENGNLMVLPLIILSLN